MSLPVSFSENIIFTKEDFHETIILLQKILHASCHRAAIHNYWLPCWNKEKNIAVIQPNNIFWLYFWAETGQGSDFAAKESRIVFYEIFGSNRPYGTKDPDYENFFRFFDLALEKTGLPFRTWQSDNHKNNPIRDALRPINCTEHCIDIFRKVMRNISSVSSDSFEIKPILKERPIKEKTKLETQIVDLYKKYVE